jgi:hypothetical protein
VRLRSGSAFGTLPPGRRVQISAVPSLLRTFNVPGRGSVSVTLEPMRRGDGSPIFTVEWWVKPARLSPQDIAAFDRGLAGARRALVAELEAFRAST